LGPALLKKIAQDQKAIWTSPARLRWGDSYWLIPAGGIAAGLFATDRDAMRKLSNSPGRLNGSRTFSNVGAVSLVGAAGGLYLWGNLSQDDHRRETGLLSGEALVNSLVVTSALKFAMGRNRPLEDNSRGRFWQNGSSFPSDHAAAAWSVASVIAHEYPGPVTKFLAYGLASAVSASRVTGKQHFPSDVVIGSAISWFIGQQVYRSHHDPELGGGSWEGLFRRPDGESKHEPTGMGSPYVPLDSWVYPALERLAALRFISSDFRGLKPWTRIECARLTEEAGEAIDEGLRGDRKVSEEVAQLHKALEQQFAPELEVLGGGRNRSFQFESAYARALSLSGPILDDSFHFGQTISNDYGRPFHRGTNVVTGARLEATYGPFFAYGWGEFQHAPAAPALPDSQRAFIARVDVLPLSPAIPSAAVDRFQPLDSYVGFNFKNWQFSYGRQSLWWGTSESGPLLLSNNAEPINMFRIDRVVPFRLPGFLGVFGPMRTDFFVGALGRQIIAPDSRPGQFFAAHPLLQGLRISFKMTRNFEFAVTHTAQYGGPGQPNGLDIFFRNFLPYNKQKLESQGKNIGHQSLSMDFLFRFSRYATFYSEFLGSDDPTPFDSLSRAAVNTGVYFARLPWSNKMDLRLEGFYTESPCEPLCAARGPGTEPGKTQPAAFLHYWHGIYRSGHTNDGFILGNAIGRDGIGWQAWTNYWFSPSNRLQLSFKRSEKSSDFIPNGAQWNDFSVSHQKGLKSGLYLRSQLQIERLRYPFLFPGLRTNVAASLELGYSRELHLR
jgi:membrane-associated phospholipid phosphatase